MECFNTLSLIKIQESDGVMTTNFPCLVGCDLFENRHIDIDRLLICTLYQQCHHQMFVRDLRLHKVVVFVIKKFINKFSYVGGFLTNYT